MLRDAHYREKLAHRGRGVEDLARTVGGIIDDIDERLANRGTVRVLELGCGYGTALLELATRYGKRVELHGMNRLPDDGNADILLRNARERGLLGAKPHARDLPTLAFGDVANGLPFPDDTFDVVYSQVAWLYFGAKLAVVRDVMRVLRVDGIAKIDADELRPQLPQEYQRLVEIWEDGALVPFADYASRHGAALTAAPDGTYLRFGKSPTFAADVVPVGEIDVATIWSDWDGIKCVYRIDAVAAQAARARPPRIDPET
ncbi:MAG TPA: class I SAM-dependent methyltransferase [Casimicrobiaceae bacterium]|nr:class I SAM-dependent methyltransferase [Casimicrobiaceae bacterium]